MPRSIRIEYPGALYHVMARGNRRERIFHDDEDRRFFLKALSQACAMTGWQVHAWVLMGNHYHLLIQTPEPNLVAGMQWLQNTYTRRFNIRHRLWGRLFGDRYKAVPVEGGGYYYETLLDYIHLNPVRARLINPRKGGSILDYPWTSVAGGYALPPGKRAPWLAPAEPLRAFACPDTAVGRRNWVRRLDRIASAEDIQQCGIAPPLPDADGRASHLRRGWYWGSQIFAEKILNLGEPLLKKTRKPRYRNGPELRSHGEQQAFRLLAEGLSAAGLQTADLPALKGSDIRKTAIATVLRERTTVSLGWVAEHLSMRSPSNTVHQIRRQAASRKPLPKSLKNWLDHSRIDA